MTVEKAENNLNKILQRASLVDITLKHLPNLKQILSIVEVGLFVHKIHFL